MATALAYKWPLQQGAYGRATHAKQNHRNSKLNLPTSLQPTKLSLQYVLKTGVSFAHIRKYMCKLQRPSNSSKGPARSPNKADPKQPRLVKPNPPKHSSTSTTHPSDPWLRGINSSTLCPEQAQAAAWVTGSSCLTIEALQEYQVNCEG